jgi:hypothetical protein
MQRLDQDRLARAGDAAGVAQGGVRDRLAHRRAAKDHRFQHQAGGIRRKVDHRLARQMAALKQDRLLRQPVKMRAMPYAVMHRHMRSPPRAAIGALGGLRGAGGAAPCRQINPVGQKVAPGQPARGVQKHDFGARRAGVQERLGRSLLMPPIKPPTIRPRQQRDMCGASAALMGHNRGGTGSHAGSRFRCDREPIAPAPDCQRRAVDAPNRRMTSRPRAQI